MKATIGFAVGIMVGINIMAASKQAPVRPVKALKPSTLPVALNQKEKPLTGSVRTVMDLPVVKSKDEKDRADFRAICMWEHRGVIRPNDVSSAGAVGPAQIRQIFLDDGNEHGKTNYTLEDCKDYEIAFKVTKAVWAKYNQTTSEERCRCHYAGPRGMKLQCTLEYWAGCKKYL